MKLSYSVINNCLQPENSHSWISRQMSREIPNNPAFETGKRIHRIIQDHVSGRHKIVNLEFLDSYPFPIVEEKDMDERTHFEFEFEGYTIHGYLDGLNQIKRQFLEIKTGSKFWSIMDFYKSPQIGIYALAHPLYTTAVCITALNDEKLWPKQPPRVYEVELTEKMRNAAKEWILKGIRVLEKGDFSGGLTDGKCLGYCNYGVNCYFR